MKVLIKSKWGRLYHLTALKLRWCRARNAKGHQTGKESTQRFEFGDFMLSFNRFRNRTENYVREITDEQSTELTRLDSEITRVNDELQALHRAKNDFIVTCFETGRPVPVEELLNILREEAKD